MLSAPSVYQDYDKSIWKVQQTVGRVKRFWFSCVLHLWGLTYLAKELL